MMCFVNLRCESSLATALVYQSTPIYGCSPKLSDSIQALAASLDEDPHTKCLSSPLLQTSPATGTNEGCVAIR